MIKHATALDGPAGARGPRQPRHAGFKEPAKVLWQHTGNESHYFGWAVSRWPTSTATASRDAIIGEPGNSAPGGDAGTTWIYSGCTGAALRRFDGEEGDQSGFAIADVGDLNRDGVHDVLSGAPRQFGDTEGHATSSQAATDAVPYVRRRVAATVRQRGHERGTSTATAAPTCWSARPITRAEASPSCSPAARSGCCTGSPRPTRPMFGYGTGMTRMSTATAGRTYLGGGGTAYVFSGRDGRQLYALPSLARRAIRHVLPGRHWRPEPRPCARRLRGRLRGGGQRPQQRLRGGLLRARRHAAALVDGRGRDGLGPGRGAGDSTSTTGPTSRSAPT